MKLRFVAAVSQTLKFW